MPLPFILAGAAIIAGGYGVKKGLDAKSDFAEAEATNEKAKNLYDEAVEELTDIRDLAQQSLETLGSTKFEVYQDALIPFVEEFSKVKHINFNDSELQDIVNLPQVSTGELDDMKKTVLEVKDILSGGVTSLGAGGLAGFAAFGGVKALAVASTGKAIAGLSGAAATNATLAWFGGGALAANGLGMAGGMAVLGGIVAGPVLAVGGMMLASKAESAKEDAYANLEKAHLAVEELKSAGVVTQRMTATFKEMNNVIIGLQEQFNKMLLPFQFLVEHNSDYRTYSDADKKAVFILASTAKTLKNLLEVPLLDESGGLTKKSISLISETKLMLQQF